MTAGYGKSRTSPSIILVARVRGSADAKFVRVCFNPLEDVRPLKGVDCAAKPAEAVPEPTHNGGSSSVGFTERDMRYQIKPKVFALGGAYHIRDDAGRDVYFVKGKAFSFANQFTVYDMGWNEVAFVKHQLVSYPTTYEIYKGGQYFGLVKQDPLTLLKEVFNVTVPGDSLVVECSYTRRQLTVMRAETTVAVASRRLFSWVRSFDVEISENEDDLMILVSIMVVVTMQANSS